MKKSGKNAKNSMQQSIESIYSQLPKELKELMNNPIIIDNCTIIKDNLEKIYEL